MDAVKKFVPISPYYRFSKNKFFFTEEKAVLKRIADIGFEVYTEQNVVADGENYD